MFGLKKHSMYAQPKEERAETPVPVSAVHQVVALVVQLMIEGGTRPADKSQYYWWAVLSVYAEVNPDTFEAQWYWQSSDIDQQTFYQAYDDWISGRRW